MCDFYLNTGDGQLFWGDGRPFEVMADCFEVMVNQNSADHSRFPYWWLTLMLTWMTSSKTWWWSGMSAHWRRLGQSAVSLVSESHVDSYPNLYAPHRSANPIQCPCTAKTALWSSKRWSSMLTRPPPSMVTSLLPHLHHHMHNLLHFQLYFVIKDDQQLEHQQRTL